MRRALASALVLSCVAAPVSGSAAAVSDAPIIAAKGQCASGPPSPTAQPSAIGIAVAESVETPRLAKLAGDADQPVVSPDGKTYALFVVRSDLAKDGQWLDILVGQTPGVGGSAAPPRCLVSLFNDARRYADVPGAHDHLVSTYPGQLNPVWQADSRRLVFAWSGGPTATQLVSVDGETGGLSQLTHSEDSIYRYLMTPDAKVIAFITNPSTDWSATTKLYRQGFVMRSLDWRKIDLRHYDGEEPWDRTTAHLQIGGETRDASKILASRGAFTSSSSLSPDGRYFVTPDQQVAAPPERWRAFKNYSPESSAVYETRVFDLTAGRSWPLIDAPDPSYDRNRPRRMVWSPDTSRLLIGRTYVPGAGASSAGRAGETTAVIDVSSGRIVELPVPDRYRDYAPLAWEKGDTLILSMGRSRIRFAPAASAWRFAGTAPASDIEIVQDMNRPSALVAGVGHGAPRVLLEIAPKLQFLRLGRVAPASWTDSAGRSWHGRLYLPPDYVAPRRYPLVVQTHGVPGEAEFSLGGPGDWATTAYAAQALATQGIAVLQMPETVVEGVPEEPKQFVEMLTGAIRRLTADGIVDPKHVGLMGYSRTCWHVEYALSHSDLEISAAVAADGIDSSYVSGTLLPYYQGYSRDHGAPPFGAGLAAWLEESPGFAVERIRAPLLLTGYVADGWELFSRMRQLKLPVELYQLPEYRTADHPVQVPSQQYQSQLRTVDWFDFWLNGHEDPDPAKREQYEGWRELRGQRDAALRAPRPPLFHWSATPIADKATGGH